MTRAARLLLVALFALPGGAGAQGFSLGEPVPPAAATRVLVIDFERVFAESAYGQALARAIEARGTALAAENRQIEADLIAEEQRLTDLRDTMAPEEFRDLAAAFDERVQRLRREQDAKARALGALSDDAQRAFVAAVDPVLQALMRDEGAAVILERRAVFAATAAVDVTDAAIARIDAAGQDLPQPDAALPDMPEPDVPETVPPDPGPPDPVPPEPGPPGPDLPGPAAEQPADGVGDP